MRRPLLLGIATIASIALALGLEVFVAWSVYYRSVAADVVHGRTMHIPRLCHSTNDCGDYAFSHSPNPWLLGGVALTCLALPVALRRWPTRTRVPLTIVAALALALWATLRLPVGPWAPGINGAPGLEVLARRFARVLEALVVCVSSLAMLLFAWLRARPTASLRSD